SSCASSSPSASHSSADGDDTKGDVVRLDDGRSTSVRDMPASGPPSTAVNRLKLSLSTSVPSPMVRRIVGNGQKHGSRLDRSIQKELSALTSDKPPQVSPSNVKKQKQLTIVESFRGVSAAANPSDSQQLRQQELRVSCPSCNLQVLAASVNSHLDSCLSM